MVSFWGRASVAARKRPESTTACRTNRANESLPMVWFCWPADLHFDPESRRCPPKRPKRQGGGMSGTIPHFLPILPFLPFLLLLSERDLQSELSLPRDVRRAGVLVRRPERRRG